MAIADWDARLLSPARALELAGDWPVYASVEIAALSQFEPEGGGDQRIPDQWQVNLRCRKCDQSCGLLGAGQTAYQTTIGDLLTGVLRHLVMAHDVPLNKAAQEGQ